MKCAIVPVTPYQQNCSIIYCESTDKVAVVDPGGDIERIEQGIEQLGGTLKKIFLTHGHMDHCAAADVLRQRYEVPIEGPHIGDKFWLDGLPETCKQVGFPPTEAFTPDRWLEQGDKVTVGELSFDVLHCPGHTPGHVVFFRPEQNIAWVGDVLFQGSIGRTDFPQGDYDTLIRSIRENLWPLGNDVAFVPGHGPTSTFGQERQSNAFVADHLFKD